MSTINRRDVLRIGALLGFCGALPYVARAIGPGLPDKRGKQSIYQARYPLGLPEGMVQTTCAGCRGGCALRSHVEVGILAKVDGSPFSPRQHGDPVPRDLAHAAELRGASCARGQARVNNVHDPYRIVRPLLRVGKRGGGKFDTTTSETALATLLAPTAERAGLRGLHRESLGAPTGAAPAVVIAVDPRHQDRRVVLDAFTARFAGARGVLGHPAASLAAATAQVLGVPGWLAAPRWDRATAIVGFGANPIAGGLDPVGTAFWAAEARASRSARIVAVDPRLSDLGDQADLWVPVRPGGDRALAHWIAQIWVEEGRVDASRVPSSVLRRPRRSLEHNTGLGPRLVGELARTLGEAGPGLAIAIGGGVTDHPGGLDTAHAILQLAALIGAMGPGGAMEPAADPIPAIDGPRELAALLGGHDSPRAVVIVGDGGVQDTPWEREVLEALSDPARVPLVIGVTTAMNRVCAQADIIVPDVTEFERMGLVRRHDGVSPVLPVLPPVPREAGLDGALGDGFEGLLGAILTEVGAPSDLGAVVWQALSDEAAREVLPGLSREDALLVQANLATIMDGRPPLSAPLAALLGRGWAPPPVADALPTPLPWPDGPAALAADPPPEGLVLVTYRESFGGQIDSDAQVWGARSVRADNPLHIHKHDLHDVPGKHSDRIYVGDSDRSTLKITEAIRPGVVALAVGYGQRHGFDGTLIIDEVTVPAAPRRAKGVPVGPLLSSGRTISLAWAPKQRDPSLWELLTPGGHAQLPSTLRKHHEDG